jgi:tetratricopeptide (TPR) repeat protein
VDNGPGAEPSVVQSQVGAGFQALAAGDWRGARDGFSAVLAAAEVPEALLGLGTALFWLGDIAGTIASCEKAYAGFRRRPDLIFAAGTALSLVGYNKGYLGNTAAARGWLARAARIIENEVPALRGEPHVTPADPVGRQPRTARPCRSTHLWSWTVTKTIRMLSQVRHRTTVPGACR